MNDEERRKIFYLKSDINVSNSILSSLKDSKKWSTFYRLIVDKKVTKANLLPDYFRDTTFVIEKTIYDHLRKKGFSSIKYLEVHKEYAVMTKAKGKNLEKSADSVSKKKKLYIDLGEKISRLHKIKTSGFGLLSVVSSRNGELVGLHKKWSKYINLNLEKHINFLQMAQIINIKTAFEIRKIFIKMNFESYQEPVLLHGDLNIRNVFYLGNKISDIVDWEDSLSGDPVFDVANFGTFFSQRNMVRCDWFLEGYCRSGKMPTDFWMRYWLYFLRIVLAKSVHRSRFGMRERNKFNSQERIFIALRELRKYET